MKGIFLDRDGVINKYPGDAKYVISWKEFCFLPRAKSAITKLHKNKFKILFSLTIFAILIFHLLGYFKGFYYSTIFLIFTALIVSYIFKRIKKAKINNETIINSEAS